GDTDLFHMGRRYYDAKTACFISRDPIWPDVLDPKSLNPYPYAAQNPLRFIDPRGELRITPDAAFTSWEELKHGDVFVKVDEMTGEMKLYRIVRMSEKKEEELKKEEVTKPIPKHIGNRATQKEKGAEDEDITTFSIYQPHRLEEFTWYPPMGKKSYFYQCYEFWDWDSPSCSIIKTDDPSTLNMNTIIHSPIFILVLLILFVWFIIRKVPFISSQKRKRKG
ncbi:MAG: hypothetical protein KAX20_03280, partial [Candidatus Omnitrophica bacterium]|nr:hypothetical protein [Candidatus Omnitrophota bacterium]